MIDSHGRLWTIIGWGFCDIQNNQGRGKGYQPKPKAEADNPYRDLDYSGYHKTESNNCFTIHWTKKNCIHVFVSSLTASSTKRANLTWLPLEIMLRGHTWHDYPWPWVSLTWLLYNLQIWRHGRCFRKFTERFRPIRKELESSMYNNMS